MAWFDVRRVKLAELLEKLTTLHSKIVELKVKQQCVRARQQGLMLRASQPQSKGKLN